MTQEPLLMIPGPTNLPKEVQEAIGRPTINHRGPEFAALIEKCNKGLQTVFQTANDVMILSSSGTGGVEAAIVNTINAQDHVLCVRGGKFGERMGEIAECYGAHVTYIEVENGKAAEPQAVADVLSRQPYRALLFVQNETSTGITQNVPSLAKIANDYGCMTILDCVSGMGGIPVKSDAWGLDVVISGSQKAFMLPPGLAFVSMSERAWKYNTNCKTPRYYFDLAGARKSLQKGQTPFTPAVNLIAGLGVSLDLMLAEGMDHVYARHASAGSATRAAVTALGLKLFADPAYASNVVTSITSPENLDSSALTRQVRTDNQITLSGGQGELKGKIFRIGHLGCVSLDDILRTIEAIGNALNKLEFECDPQAGVTAAREAWKL